MNDLSSTARAILDAGRDADSAGDLERARVRKALMAKIAAGGALTATSTAVAASSTAAAAPTAKILVALAMVVASGVGGTLAWRAQRTPAAPPALAPAPTPAPVITPVIAPATVVAPVAPPAEPVTRHVAPARRARPTAHVEAPANRLAEETALLAAANGELRNGDARRTLGLLDDYDRRYPSGVLREEVLATRVIARCQIGLAPDATARRAANTFLSRYPASPLAPRVRSSCGR